MLMFMQFEVKFVPFPRFASSPLQSGRQPPWSRVIELVLARVIYNNINVSVTVSSIDRALYIETPWIRPARKAKPKAKTKQH